MKKVAFLFACVLLSCGNPNKEQRGPVPVYFDVKGYFNKEAMALGRRSPIVDKTVSINGTTENKKLKISNWDKELASFIDADINKRAWEGEFSTVNTSNSTVYSSDNEKVPVKKLEVVKENGKVSAIIILISNSNYLYSSTDTLRYYPDSLYQIRKSQQIKLMAPKRYQITGTF
jgi:hypothetical protein